MAGFFTLELDTTAPEIQVYAPNYTTVATEMEITVQANERLSDGYQDFYVMDQYGNKHSFTFAYDGHNFNGKITLSEFDNGLITFYAQVQDEVGNLSPVATKTIQVIPSVNYLRLAIEDSVALAIHESTLIVRQVEAGSPGTSKLEPEISRRTIDMSSENGTTTTSIHEGGTTTGTEVVK